MSNYQLNNFTHEVEKEIRREAFNLNYYYENTYLHEHNQICPLCNKSIKLDRKNFLSKIGLIGVIAKEEEEVCISYALCKKCSKKLSRYSKEKKKESENIISIHILTELNNSG